MKYKLQKYTIFLLGILLMLCSVYKMEVYATEQEVTGHIKVGFTVAESEIEEYLDAFRLKYPGTTIEIVYLEDYDNNMRNMVLSGEFPDVLMLPGSLTIQECVEYLQPLGTMEELKQKYNFLESSMNDSGLVYGIPSSAYTAGFLYNKKVFAEAGITELPKSTDEFLEAMRMIKERTDAIPFYTNYNAEWVFNLWEMYPYIEMTGDAKYKENDFVFEEYPFSEEKPHYTVYKLLYDLVHEGLTESDPRTTEWATSQRLLNRGKIGCIAIGSWAVVQVQEAGQNADDIGFMPFPNEINGKQYMTVCTNSCYGINKNSKNPATARAFLDFMLDESGYALDEETVSIVKTDPYPKSFGQAKDVIMMTNAWAEGNHYQLKQKLVSKFDINNTAVNIRRIIESASGMIGENFEQIMKDFNIKWESGRTSEMRRTQTHTQDKVEKEEKQETQETVIENSIQVNNYQVDFSQTEKKYIEDIKVLKVGYQRNLAPIQYETINEEGEAVFNGVAAEICKKLEEATGLTLEYYGYDDVTSLVDALNKNEIHMIASLENRTTHVDMVKFSKEYLSFSVALIKYDGIENQELTNKKMALMTTDDLSIIDFQPRGTMQMDSIEEMIRAVDSGEADFAACNYYSANYYLRQTRVKNTEVVPLAKDISIAFAFAKGCDSRLVSICNKIVYSISEEDLQVMLLNGMDVEEGPVTLFRFIEDNPYQSMVVLCGIFTIIVVAVVLVMYEKNKSAKKHALDVKRYEVLASLVDEYVYEYDMVTECIHFDTKFNQRFGFEELVYLKEYNGDNENLNILIDNYKLAVESSTHTSPPFEFGIGEDRQWYRVIAHVIRSSSGKELHVVGKLINVQKEMEEKHLIENKAFRDPLTGLFNRDGFQVQFDKIYNDMEHMMPVTFAVLDMDNFKAVNDTLGHAGGDEALKLLARSLEELFGDRGAIARYGGDEFIFCIYGIEEARVRKLLTELVLKMCVELPYQGTITKISISLGAAITNRKANYAELFKSADKALYVAKENGKNGFHLVKYGIDE